MFQSREHKVNTLLKENRVYTEQIFRLIRDIRENEVEIVRLYREVQE